MNTHHHPTTFVHLIQYHRAPWDMRHFSYSLLLSSRQA
ncbi:Uncharacterised protein [Salmonella enterica subsp. indica]|uniref:Uncharacterized protein n=1 Tax=Salmonella enterica subsp. indica TaxID=59207 RepID=A0A379YKH3_SALER|nr:Uncharacterised protein [Salmonella enterica subsp. indica]